MCNLMLEKLKYEIQQLPASITHVFTVLHTLSYLGKGLEKKIEVKLHHYCYLKQLKINWSFIITLINEYQNTKGFQAQSASHNRLAYERRDKTMWLRVDSQFYHLVELFCTSHLTFLCLHFLMYRMHIVTVPTSWGYCTF